MHERLVFELLGIRERITGNVTRKALSTNQKSRPRLHSSDEVNLHKAPLRSAPLLRFFHHCPMAFVEWGQVTRPGHCVWVGQQLQTSLLCDKASLRSLNLLCLCIVLALAAVVCCEKGCRYDRAGSVLCSYLLALTEVKSGRRYAGC